MFTSAKATHTPLFPTHPPHPPTHPKQPQHQQLYEDTDLQEFRGKRVIVDAASFVFFIMEDVMGRQVRLFRLLLLLSD